jgi:tight adherence protein C
LIFDEDYVMTDQIAKSLFDPAFLIAILVSIAVFATIFTVIPVFGRPNLNARMKAVALERDVIKARERARMNDSEGQKTGLRYKDSGIRGLVDALNLKTALADEGTRKMLLIAGMRGPKPLSVFLFARFTLPFVTFAIALFYIFVMGGLAEQTTTTRIIAAVVGAYVGFYLPILYVSNAAGKRKAGISRAWPDALDLLLICVESGMSIEAGFRRVSDEIGLQSVDLAEELMLTTSELSFLPERKQAYENLYQRTGLEIVKSVMQALVQAERYGTPVSHALRVLSDESREMRMNEAEKKAAALPPKLTVPMILFFLPVIFLVVLGPAYITVSAQGGIFGDGG